MLKINTRLTSVIVIIAIAVMALLSFNAAQASLEQDKHCVMHLSPVTEDSAESSKSTPLGCYDTFEEAFNFQSYQNNVLSSDTSDSSESIYSNKGGHCVRYLSPISVDSDKPSKSTSISHGCYETFAEAIFVATNGALKLNNDFLPENLTQEMLDTAQNQKAKRSSSSLVIGVNYKWSNFQGLSLTWHAPDSCGDGTWYAEPTLPWGWNDSISSSRGYSGCDEFIHLKDANYGGTSITCDMGDTCDTMGIMNNETSSLIWERR